MEPQIDQPVVIQGLTEIGKKTVITYGKKYKISAMTDKLYHNPRVGTWLHLTNIEFDKPMFSFWVLYEEKKDGKKINGDNNFFIELKEKYNGQKRVS